MQVFHDLDTLPVFKNAVITIGSFDGVHEGHRRILDRLRDIAREAGGEAVVITFEPHPRLVLWPDDADFRLLNTLDEKLQLLQLTGVDATVVVPFSKNFAGQAADEYVEDFLVKKFKPHTIVIGYDHRFGNNREGGIDFLKKNGAKHDFSVVEIPKHEIDNLAVSSTKIRNAIENADIQTANKLLGHPFQITGTVIKGDQIGRAIGFPTANIFIETKQKLVPPPGIYAALVSFGFRVSSFELPHPKPETQNTKLKGMLYIGSRPTISQSVENQRVEVNLLDFDGDIYGQILTVEIVDFIRPDKKLDSLDALKSQIEADKKSILKKFASVAPIRNPQSVIRNPKVAVVILNYNTRRHLEAFLPAVLATDYPNFEVVVADNASPDDSVLFLEQNYPNIKILKFSENSGFAGGYNRALAMVEADYFVLLNSDVEVTPGWITPIVERMEAEPNIAIAQPKIRAEQARDRFEYAGAAGGWVDILGYPFCRGRIFDETEIDFGQYDAPQDCFWAAGAAMFIRSKTWRDFGGFDADYFAHNEEIDLCWRTKRAGFRVICEPRSVVFHLGGGTLEYENPRKVFLNFRNSLFTILKNEPAGKLFWLIPARFLLDGLAGIVFLLKGKTSSFTAIVRAHFSFYGHFFSTLEKRRRAAQLIENQRIGPMNRGGILLKSVVWEYYIGRVKRYSGLF